MAEPFDIKKAVDLTPAALGKSTTVVIKGVLVLIGIGLFGLGIWVILKPHFIKPAPTTGITGDVGTLNQDCSKQVCDAIVETEKRTKQKEPWIDLDFKIIRLSIPGKR
jgi:hypothetical protein